MIYHIPTTNPGEPPDPRHPPAGTVFQFGDALDRLKMGRLVSRAGWNGKGMYLFLAHCANMRPMKDMTDGVVETRPIVGPCLSLSGAPEPTLPVDPVICMRTATGTIQPGWLASQADMLASDWGEVAVGHAKTGTAAWDLPGGGEGLYVSFVGIVPAVDRR